MTVQPVAIDYGALPREIAWVGEEAAGANAKRRHVAPGHDPGHACISSRRSTRTRRGDRKTLAAAVASGESSRR